MEGESPTLRHFWKRYLRKYKPLIVNYWCRSDVFIFNTERISHLFLQCYGYVVPWVHALVLFFLSAAHNYWSEWTNSGSCMAAKCGAQGKQEQRRKCIDPPGKNCTESLCKYKYPNTKSVNYIKKIKCIKKCEGKRGCFDWFWIVIYPKAATRSVLRKDVLKNSAIFTGKHLCWSLSSIKGQVFKPGALLKRDSSTGPVQVFSCEYWEIFKNTYFEEHLPTVASVYLLFIV